jgi:hypothetical protein
MKWLKSKTFWLSVAHIAVAGAGIAGGVLFPPFAPIIISGQALVNGLIPSPIQPKPSSTAAPIAKT